MGPRTCFIILLLCSSILAICQVTPGISERYINKPPFFDVCTSSIACENTSSEDFAYDVMKLVYSSKHPNPLTRLDIVNSDFSVIEDLYNPLIQPVSDGNLYVSVKISTSHVKTIDKDAFANFPTLRNLDLSDNEIEDLTFVSNLPTTVSTLNLKHNKISRVNFELFRHILESLDLSFNTIKKINFSSGPSDFPVTTYLNLENNHITTIGMVLALRNSDYLTINMAKNPLESILNCKPSPEESSRISLLNVSNSLTNLSMGDFTRCGLKFRGLACSGNKVLLDNSWDSSDVASFDYSNSSITSIPRELFQNRLFESLNLSHSNLDLKTYPVFMETEIVNTLDISYCKIKSVEYLFFNIVAGNINLSGNQIQELNINSFRLIGLVSRLNLSYNNLTLKNNCFIDCKDLSTLILTSSNISLIEEGAFNGLIDLTILHLENNLLKTLKSNVFSTLIKINEIYLQNNQLTVVPSELFSSALLLSVVNLNGNNIELIEHQAFHNLNNLDYIEIHNNNASLKIEEDAFSELPALKTVSLMNSGLTKTQAKAFFKTPHLRIIDVSNNNITSIDFSKPNELNALEELRITLVGDLKSKSFLKMKFLKSLTFCNSKIKTVEKRAFQGLLHLTSLQIINSDVSILEDGALDGLFRLEHLYLENVFKNKASLNSFTFQDLTSLTYLNISYQGLENIALNAFKGLKNLQHLSLNNNGLTSFKNLTFAGLESLERLDVSYNKLNVLQRDSFNGLNSLNCLNLGHNSLNDIDLGVFQQLPNLESLILRKNNLTEIKIGAFSNLNKLKNLDLSQNNISNLKFQFFLPLVSLSHLNLEFNNLKTFGRYTLVPNLKYLVKIGIAKNKWQCDYLGEMLVIFRQNEIDFSSENINFYDDNVEGIECIDICKYLLCLKDSHGIN